MQKANEAWKDSRENKILFLEKLNGHFSEKGFFS
jgi:hypothetical protein